MNKCLYIPREINQDYVFIWKRDEIIFLMLPWIFFFILGGLLGFMLTLIGTIVVGQILKQMSLDKPNGYMLHWVKYNIPKQYIAATLSRSDGLEAKESLLFRGDPFPSSHIRHLAG
jgi:hypothetical protein